MVLRINNFLIKAQKTPHWTLRCLEINKKKKKVQLAVTNRKKIVFFLKGVVL